jgi:hypothetical protein
VGGVDTIGAKGKTKGFFDLGFLGVVSVYFALEQTTILIWLSEKALSSLQGEGLRHWL